MPSILTNQAVADRLGVHHSLVSRLRSGERLPGPELLERIATEYDVSLDKLLRTRNRGHKAFSLLFRQIAFQSCEPTPTPTK